MESVIVSRELAAPAPEWQRSVPMGVQLVGGKSVSKNDW